MHAPAITGTVRASRGGASPARAFRAFVAARNAGAAVLLGLGLALPLRAVELAASGLSIPFFNDAGELTHKVIAQRGLMVDALQHLQVVEIAYFAPGDPTRVIQRVTAAEATWDEKREILAGRGMIEVETEENRLTGQGFDFALATSQLNIERDFTMTNRELRLTSDRAVVDLVIQRKGEEVKVRDVRRCEALGNLQIHVLPTAENRYHFDDAFSDRAIYESATHTITLPNQIRFVRGRRSSTSNKFEIKLDEKGKTAPPEKP